MLLIAKIGLIYFIVMQVLSFLMHTIFGKNVHTNAEFINIINNWLIQKGSTEIPYNQSQQMVRNLAYICFAIFLICLL